MARVAFILDRIFRKFGLSGRAFMPMIMGFGCSVPAMINTRTLADEKEKTAIIVLGVIISSIINKKKGKCNCDCSTCPYNCKSKTIMRNKTDV